jgi:hypothetical protein
MAARCGMVGLETLRNAWHSVAFSGIRLFDNYAIEVFPPLESPELYSVTHLP